MKTNRILLLAVIVTTTLCGALVWSNVVATSRTRELKAQLETKEAKVQELSARIDRASRNTGDAGLSEMLTQRDTEYEQLRDAYDKLKMQLAAASTLNVTMPAVTSTPTRADSGPFPRRNMNAYLERMRQQDPQRYQEIVQRFQQRQQQAAQEYDDQMGTLAARAQNAATPEEADLLNQISDTLDKVNQLRQQLRDTRAAVADLPEDQQQAQVQPIRDQINTAMEQARNFQDQDKKNQLGTLAGQLGVKDSQALIEGVQQVEKSIQQDLPARGPGGFGGGGGPPSGATSSSSAGSSSATTPSQQPSTTAK